jgi:hypothetical protein
MSSYFCQFFSPWEFPVTISTLEIPNETTLKAFAEDKSAMPVFHSVEELRKDLL